MKKVPLHLFLLLTVILSSCSHEDVTDDPSWEGPLKVTKLLPLSNDVPYHLLGSGKIVFERIYDQERTSFYVIDIDQKKSSGFILNSRMKQPAISPAGDIIACALQNSGDANPAWNIYVMKLDGTGCFPAFISEQHMHYPVWNDDGSKLFYYTSGSEGALYMQSPVENSPDRVEVAKFYDPGDPDWLIDPLGRFTVSDSGNFVSVSTSDTLDGLISIEPYKGKEGVNLLLNPSTDLFFVSPNFSVESPVFSPDGSFIAFISLYINPIENSVISVAISVINPEGNYLASVGALGGHLPDSRRPFMSLCWSPDATKLLFSMPDAENTSHLYVLNLDDSGIFQVTNQPFVRDCNVSWSK